MHTQIKRLAPQPLWQTFADLNAVPRPSKQEAKAAEFVLTFGRSLGLEAMQDEAGNVLIRKPAMPGMENRKTVLLQAHLDMVHQKNNGTNFDFDTQGIDMYVDGDWVKAKGTTLGADNGIGVAAIMAVLASDSIVHPPLEALFTVDEEKGASGALSLRSDLLQADILLNLDSEDDRQLTIGCAGSLDITATGTYDEEEMPTNMQAYRLSVKGLTGGHSGVDIHRGRGNAIKILNRLLYRIAEQIELRIGNINGGGLRNAIPREALAEIAVRTVDVQALGEIIRQETETLKVEHAVTDPQLEVSFKAVPLPATVLPVAFQTKLLRALYTCPNGISRLSPSIAGLVQTSNNLSCLQVLDGQFSALALTRSFSESEKLNQAQAVRCAFELAGATVSFAGSVPGWQPDPETDFVRLVQKVYRQTFKIPPVVSAIHAGLECGIIGAKYPHMEMISFGPTIHGAHSPEERVQISSVQRFWLFLLELLREIPEVNK